MRNLLRSLLLVGIISSCVWQNGLEEPSLQVKSLNPDQLVIPDGFDFNMSTNLPLKISIQTNGARLSASDRIQYAIFGTDATDEVYVFKSGHLILGESLVSIDKPMHIQNLYLFTKYDGNSKFFDLTSESITLSLDDLYVDDAIFEIQANARTTSTPDCTSFLGNATKLICEEDGFLVKSSASFQYLDLIKFNGDTITVLVGTIGSLNANANQWTLTSSELNTAISEIAFIDVYADCQTAPQTIGLELVHFANPCLDSINDSDNDGVLDDADIFPSDPLVSGVAFVPARDRYATFAFEDLWPYKGDYDFNDLVISHHAIIYVDANEQVAKVDYSFFIRAIGASFDNDLCVSFTNDSSFPTIQSMSPDGIDYSNHDLVGLSEIRFKSVKNLFESNGFINTDTTKAFYNPVEVHFTLLFDQSCPIDDFKIDEYLRINQQEGREVHKPGVPYTSLIQMDMIGRGDDDTRPQEGKYFKTIDNLPWVLEIPIEWEYPKEQKHILEAYPNFEEFAQGNSNSPWYTDESGNKVHKNIYRKNQ